MKKICLSLLGFLALLGLYLSYPANAKLKQTSQLIPAPVKASTTTKVIVAVGDIACTPGAVKDAKHCQQQATANLTKKIAPDRVLALGDLQYEKGSYAGFLNSYDKSWGALKSITKPVPGNHEYYTAGAAGYYKYFAKQQPGAPGYYVFKLGAWRIFQLNSNCDVIDCAKEQTWFANQLKLNPTKCTMMTMHHPRFSSGEHASQAFVKPFWQIAYRHRVDVALAGHDHDYERFARKTPSGSYAANGIVSFVSGAGGKNFYQKTVNTPGSKYFQSKSFGVLKMFLRNSDFSFSFLDVNGNKLDYGKAGCV